MAKKRKCRYTAEELDIHDQAVKLRKMTDKQLVEAFNTAQNASDTSECRLQDDRTNYTGGVERLLKELSEGKCKGVKNATVYKITEFAKEMELI